MKHYPGWEKDAQEIAELEKIELLIERGAYFLIFVLLALMVALVIIY